MTHIHFFIVELFRLKLINVTTTEGLSNSSQHWIYSREVFTFCVSVPVNKEPKLLLICPRNLLEKFFPFPAELFTVCVKREAVKESQVLLQRGHLLTQSDRFSFLLHCHEYSIRQD